MALQKYTPLLLHKNNPISMEFTRNNAPFIGMSLILFIVISISCKQESKGVSNENTHDYLIGLWERTNEEEGRNTYEVWSKNGAEYSGIGYTMSSGDTIWKESLRLFKQDTTWTLEVSGVNESPTPFILTNHTTNSFIAENPNNEFPKTISYRYFDDTITAIISDDETEIPFIFWRMNE